MSEEKHTKYKSPLRKLVTFFEQSRNQWKEKYLNQKLNIKRLKNRVKYLEKSKTDWKQKAVVLKQKVKELEIKHKQLEKKVKSNQIQKNAVKKNIFDHCHKDFEIIPYNHKYPIGIVMLSLSLILKAASSLRGSSRTLDVVINFSQLSLPIPSWHSVRLWLLRLGYYKLHSEKELANDWIWIVDHSIQLGTEKVFVILGIRMSNMPPAGKSLKHKDVSAITLSPVTKSNGQIVYEQLEDSIKKTGVPRAIVGDYGSDLKAGINMFCKVHTYTDHIHDIKHKTALVLKEELQSNEAWNQFKSQATQVKQQLQQTSLAPYCPPNQRSKARYMNVEPLIKWGSFILKMLEKPDKHPELFLEKFAWLNDYRESLHQWNEMIEVITTVEIFVKKQGITSNSHYQLKKHLKQTLTHRNYQRTEIIMNKLLNFINEMAEKCQAGERLLASSEVIESVFGKQKRLEQEQASSGFTGLILSIAAMVSTTTSEVVMKALETVSTRRVLTWCKQNLGPSIQAKRITLFSMHKTE
ncbi:MAG TPA: hypothetical protein ENK88_07330 [Campylobacterales bacterium]|nr:hypothetical protein [Campylobacterales bacterium]